MSSNIVEQKFNQKAITVVGAGLAGSECALQLANMGFNVVLYEMRDKVMTPAHKTSQFAELVCSNSFGTESFGSAPAQLKWEAEKLGSFILKAAKEAQVPAGQALSVDRELFGRTVSAMVKSHPLIEVRTDVVESLAQIPRPAVIATGPLTHENLANDLKEHFGDEFLYFFDAIAPIIDADSINMDICWKADRYDKGTPDYINCPLDTKDQYRAFIKAVTEARKIEPKHFETTQFFEGCMPIEVMVERGSQTLRFGPMKPVGLINPKTGCEPWAVVQLRQDNKEATAYNMVGFQTRMAYGEQARVFRTIPGLENAEFLKLGSIHRNLFINSPKRLNRDLSSQNDPWLFFAGQITGVEGYFESTCIGLMVARFLKAKLEAASVREFNYLNVSEFCPLPPRASALGSLLEGITDFTRAEIFQPTNINFGLFPRLDVDIADKRVKKETIILKAQSSFLEWMGPNRPKTEKNSQLNASL